jgi:predicted RNA binding protein YcfA (HicA-like mRNA interferase family)
VPARLSKICAAASGYGIEIVEPSRGSHWKARKPGFRTYTIPAHNGRRTEISDHYIHAFCRNFGIDPADFKSKL